MFKKREKGFTLIELMIVVAIIGILAAIAIPRFADLIKKAKEGGTKGNLGAIRSALSVYYSDNEGKYPGASADGADANLNILVPTYLDAFPTVKTGRGEHADVSSVHAYRGTTYDSKGDATITDDGQWGYWYNGAAAGAVGTYAGVFVSCTHTDTKGDGIHSW